MVLSYVKYGAEDFELLSVSQPMIYSIWVQFLQNCHNAQNIKMQVKLNPEMALTIE